MPVRALPAAALAAALFVSPAIRAEDTAPAPCAAVNAAAVCAAAPRDGFRPESQLRAVVENFLRYRVHRVGVDGGCYTVHASDRRGTPFEVRFRGQDLRMISRHAVQATAFDATAFNR